MNELWLKAWAWAYENLLAKLTQPEGGVGVVEELGSGYSVEDERMGDVAKLRALQDEAVANSAWQAHDITGDGKPETFCNRASRFIAEGMGFFGFKSTDDANAMIFRMSAAAEWREDSIERAHKHAERGGLAFMTLEDHPHAHLCSIVAAPMEESSTWAEKVPIVANIGPLDDSGIVRASKAFRADAKPSIRCFLLGETA